MSKYGRAALAALERGPMTIPEISLEAGISKGKAREYVRYHLACQPPRVHVGATEKSEVSGRIVSVYAIGPEANSAALGL